MRETIERISRSLDNVEAAIKRHRPKIDSHEIGTITKIGRGVAEISGLPGAQNDELLRFPKNQLGYVFNLDESSIGCVLLDHNDELKAGDEVRRSHRVLDVPVGEDLLGRVIDPIGRPLDERGPIETLNRLPIDRPAAEIMERAPVSVPLQTGIKVIDGLIPIGRGQRQLVVGDHQTGKTTIAIDTIINQKNKSVVCIYCAIGQRSASIAGIVNRLLENNAMDYCVVVVGESDATPGLQFAAPYSATSIGEYFVDQGRDVLVVYDEMGTHARAYREMSLLLRRPPGREAFPGDIFHVHAKLLERATCLRKEEGKGSLTALPLVETEAQNVSAYIPTNLISITDGQVYLSPERFRKGLLPAVDVGRSVSRVGGKVQLAAYRKLTGPLRLAYSQFEELEKFARFSSQLDIATKKNLRRGQSVRHLLKQNLGDLKDVVSQIASFIAVTHGVFDEIELQELARIETALSEEVSKRFPKTCEKVVGGESLSNEDTEEIVALAKELSNVEGEEKTPTSDLNRSIDEEGL